jgi:hypothetical protein
MLSVRGKVADIQDDVYRKGGVYHQQRGFFGLIMSFYEHAGTTPAFCTQVLD